MKKITKNNEINTKISIKEFFDARFNELKNYMDVKFSAMEKSTCLAQDNLNTRLESMNEFRNSLKDQTAHYVTRAEHNSLAIKYELEVKNLQKSIDENKLYISEQKGKASVQSVYMAYVFAVVGMIIGIIGLLI